MAKKYSDHRGTGHDSKWAVIQREFNHHMAQDLRKSEASLKRAVKKLGQEKSVVAKSSLDTATVAGMRVSVEQADDDRCVICEDDHGVRPGYMALVTNNERALQAAGFGWCVDCKSQVAFDSIEEWTRDGDNTNRTAICLCWVDALVPGSHFSGMSSKKRKQILREWSMQGFGHP